MGMGMGCFTCGLFPPSRSAAVEATPIDSVPDDGSESGVRRFGWDEVQRLTADFSEIIGSGGFSVVYLARFLGSNSQGRLGAVKIHNGSERLNRVFRQELEILLRLNHPHIVKLLGYCDEREEGALVFEHIAGGNLQERLHGCSSSPPIPWRRRVSIAFQLAQAIEYLHEKCELQIVHGDVKSSNILLDNDVNVKLCDFGFSKMGFSSTVTPPPSKHVIMMGSPGYTDPHYLRTGIASKKNDVYSLGVVILELVTGSEAFCPDRGQFLTTIVAPKLNESINVMEMVDPRLGGEFDLEEVKAMLWVSGMCISQSHTARPSATRVLEMMREKIPAVGLNCWPEEKDSKLML